MKKERLYLDFNATSPLAASVKEYLAKGEFFYANPSSVHSSGKRSKRAITSVNDYLKNLYYLTDSYHSFFHSGATEGSNTLLQGSAKFFNRAGEKVQYILSATDHSCVVNQKTELLGFGHIVEFYSSDESGVVQISEIKKLLKNFDGKSVVHYTWVNNETGVESPLEWAAALKKEFKCYVVVDAVQSVGKLKHWRELNLELDAYNFSGHKFGSLKGVGWSFVNKEFTFAPLLRGGGQQSALRSGTENTDGIFSLKLALEELGATQNFELLKEQMDKFREKLLEFPVSKLELVGSQNNCHAVNTFCLILKKQKADISLIAFDLEGIDISSGSACSSGALEPSRVLLAMGYDKQNAKSAIRISFPFVMTNEEYQSIEVRLLQILQRIC